MIGYVKSKSTFQTLAHAPVISYKLPIETTGTDKGTVVFADEQMKDREGEWLYIANRLYVIHSINPQDNKITYTLDTPEAMFDRMIKYSVSAAENYTGAFIKKLLEEYYVNQPDAVYDMPYITVRNFDETEYVRPVRNSYGLYSIYEYCQYVRQIGIKLNFIVSQNSLTIDIVKVGIVSHNVPTNDGHTQLYSETYSKGTIAKVTIYQGSVGNTYYLDTEGNISTTEPESRAVGDWLVAGDISEDDPLTVAKRKFSKNTDQKKIELYSDRAFDIHDTLNVRIGSRLISTKVSCIYIQSTDSRYYYRCGNLATTLTEIVKGVKTNGN